MSGQHIVLYQFMCGMLMAGSWTVALFFFKFWRRTQERLFAIFAGAFIVFGIERAVLVFFGTQGEEKPRIYLIRMMAFLILAIAIIDKNRRKLAP